MHYLQVLQQASFSTTIDQKFGNCPWIIRGMAFYSQASSSSACFDCVAGALAIVPPPPSFTAAACSDARRTSMSMRLLRDFVVVRKSAIGYQKSPMTSYLIPFTASRKLVSIARSTATPPATAAQHRPQVVLLTQPPTLLFAGAARSRT